MKKALTVIRIRLLPVVFWLLSAHANGQQTEGSTPRRSLPGFLYTRQQASRKILGNATYLAGGFTFANHGQFHAELGRTLVNTAELQYYSRTIGAGYSYQFTKAGSNYYHLFYDYSYTYLMAGLTGRLEAITNERLDQYYLRPSAGITYGPIPGFHIDVLYSYAFLLNGSDNVLKGGLTVMVKLIAPEKITRHEILYELYH